MTIEEKVAQLTSATPIPVGGTADSEGALIDADGTVDAESTREVLADGIGHSTRIGGGPSLEPERAAEVTDDCRRSSTPRRGSGSRRSPTKSV